MDANNAAQIIAPLTSAQEGFSADPYFDVNGYAIGYGNHYYQDGTQVTADDPPISRADAYALLTYTLAQTAQQVAGYLTNPVSDNLLAGLTDLAYNWGVGNFSNSKVLQLINAGADQGAITGQWAQTAVTAGGKPSTDLVARRAAEINFAFGTPETLPMSAVLILVGIIVLAAVVLRK